MSVPLLQLGALLQPLPLHDTELAHLPPYQVKFCAVLHVAFTEALDSTMLVLLSISFKHVDPNAIVVAGKVLAPPPILGAITVLFVQFSTRTELVLIVLKDITVVQVVPPNAIAQSAAASVPFVASPGTTQLLLI